MRPVHRMSPGDIQRQRTGQRDRALARLSRLTTTTAVVGTFAIVGFGGLAAITYHGVDAATTSDQPALTNVSNPADDQAAVQQQPATSSRDGAQAAAPQAQATQPPTTTRQYTYVQPPTRTTRRARATTGGSG